MKYRLKKITGIQIGFLALLFVFLSVSTIAEPPASGQTYLYKTTFVRAAPGKLLDLIGLFKKQMALYEIRGDETPFWWRHTQGDQWDLMLLFPMKSYTDYFSPDRVAQRKKNGGGSSLSNAEFTRQFKAYSAWHEDIFVFGPPLEAVKSDFKDSSYFHVEIFVALPGKHEELYKEREMENKYQVGIGRPETLIFTRDQGAAWDLFTLGCYRSLKHWAGSADIPKEKKEASARAAGFKDGDSIGPYMRSLIFMHRDTMGVAIK